MIEKGNPFFYHNCFIFFKSVYYQILNYLDQLIRVLHELNKEPFVVLIS